MAKRDFSPPDSDRIFFSRTTDRGATWSERTRVDDRGGDCLDSSNTLEGATTAVTRNGEICIAWCGRDTIYFDRSLDGGRTFGHDRAIELQPGGWNFKVPGIFRANGFPMLSSDMNPASPFYGRLYIMWSDQRRGVTDVRIVRPYDRLSVRSPPLHQVVESVEHMPVAQVPGLCGGIVHRSIISFRRSDQPRVLRRIEKAVTIARFVLKLLAQKIP